MKITARKQVRDYLINKMGYWNYIKETGDKFTIHKDGTVEYYAYGEGRSFHVDEINEEEPQDA